MIQIIPAILATTEEQYKEELSKLETSESLNDGWVHIDIIDNKFAANQTIEPEIISKYPTNLKKEVHLMVVNPKDYLERMGQVDRVIVHAEIQKEELESLFQIKDHPEFGLAINPETQPQSIKDYAQYISSILIMGVNPGLQGQEFIAAILEKIAHLREVGFEGKIGLDGGVNDKTIKQIVDLSPDYLIAGSFLMKGDVDENIEKLWEILA